MPDEFSLREGRKQDRRIHALLTAKDLRMLDLCARKRGLLSRYLDLHPRFYPAVAAFRTDYSLKLLVKKAGILFKNEQERYYQPGRKFASTMRHRKTA